MERIDSRKAWNYLVVTASMYLYNKRDGMYCYKSINCKTSRERKKTIFTQDETISIHHFLMKF